jgi:hypothetical protein
MGMVLGFRRVTPEELTRALEDPELAEELMEREILPGEPDGYLDKSWDGLQFLFDQAEVSVDLRMDGEALDEEAHLAGWDVHLVAWAAQQLSATPFEHLARHFDPARMTADDRYPRIWNRGDALSYLEAHYEGLVEFLTDVAAAGFAAIRYFG